MTNKRTTVSTKHSAKIKPKFLPPKNDFIFKELFGDVHNTELLGAFLKATLDFPDDEIEDITITDPHLQKESKSDKMGILDVRARTKSGMELDIEIQVKESDFLKNRIEFYNAKMLTKQMSAGDDYDKMCRVINIVITDFDLNKDGASDVYHHRFVRYDPVNKIQFSDLTSIHTLELTKLPPMDDKSQLWDWLKFLSSTKEEEFIMIAEKNPTVAKAVNKLTVLSEDERTQMIYEARENARRDAVSFENYAMRKGLAEGRTKGLAEGRTEGLGLAVQVLQLNHSGKSAEEIASTCNLTIDDVNAILNYS